ncbi:MAG: hypothetical protein CUN54_08325 [Phototrophicales bacterium]|nr:MAG: hypothetical protein CUN54_08325 [Phototrophicales bacterium]
MSLLTQKLTEISTYYDTPEPTLAHQIRHHAACEPDDESYYYCARCGQQWLDDEQPDGGCPGHTTDDIPF